MEDCQGEQISEQATSCTRGIQVSATDAVPPARTRGPADPVKRQKTNKLLRKISLFSISDSLDGRVSSSLKVPLTIQQVVVLIVLILLVIVVLQIPTVLFYANPPRSSSDSTSFINGIDVQTCSVSLNDIIISALLNFIVYAS